MPQNSPGFDGKHLRSIAQPRLDKVTKHHALAYFQNTWALYELLFSSLQGEEAFYRPPQHGLRHPMQFYYGHTAVFYINKSIVAGLLEKSIEPAFESVFEVGVDEMRWDDMTLGDKLWPRVSQVTEYRREVYKIVVDLIQRQFQTGEQNIGWDHPLWSFFMACEHDRIHLETSSVLLRELPLNLLRKPEMWPQPSLVPKENVGSIPVNELVPVKGGRVRLGKDVSYPTHGWDNEYGHRDADVADFKASKFLATNGEFLEFVKAGGYRERRFWSEDGWGWRRFRNAQHPFFWVRNGPAGSHKYLLRHMFELGELALGLPAVVNHHEAKAFCNWKQEQRPELKGLRLITEAEHQLIVDKNQRMESATVDTDPAIISGGDKMDSTYHVNSALSFGGERPVDAHQANKQGFHDAMGNLWQWCEDEMAPMEGFQTHPFYGDFTEPCFDGKHKIIKGGSFASTGDNGGNAHCRFHFRPHFLQQSGLRYVLPSKPEARAGDAGAAVFLSQPENVPSAASSGASASSSKAQQTQQDYETREMVNSYLALHFGKDSPIIPHVNSPDHALDFPRRCAALTAEMHAKFAVKSKVPTRALDLGCAVGGSTFQMAALGFGEVVGVDFSNAFIAAADKMRDQGKATFRLDADRKDTTVELSRKETETRMHTRFLVGDACKLPVKELGKFDAVLGANLLCRLPDPHACLNQLPELVTKGGVVLFVSPFSWLSGFTHSSRWLGPVGQSERELEHEMRSLGFSKVHEEDVPLIIREHRRKYQYIVSYASAFRHDG